MSPQISRRSPPDWISQLVWPGVWPGRSIAVMPGSTSPSLMRRMRSRYGAVTARCCLELRAMRSGSSGCSARSSQNAASTSCMISSALGNTALPCLVDQPHRMIGMQMRQHHDVDCRRIDADGAQILRQLAEFFWIGCKAWPGAGVAEDQLAAMADQEAVDVERQRLAVGNAGQARAVVLVDAEDDIVVAVQHAVGNGGDGELADLLRAHAARCQRGLAADHVGGLLRHHQHAGVDVRGHEVGHRRGIDHAQPLGAMHAELRIDHRVGARSP